MPEDPTLSNYILSASSGVIPELGLNHVVIEAFRVRGQRNLTGISVFIPMARCHSRWMTDVVDRRRLELMRKGYNVWTRLFYSFSVNDVR